jgi:translation initiation factor 2 beta subunit (eIF-2beta)/eIF-5
MASHLNSGNPGINIGGGPLDGSYRYKMPQMVVQYQGNSTILPNIGDVAKALRVQPQWLVQYFTYRFGLRSKYDAKSKVATLVGQIGEADVRRYRDQFIAQFVLCPECGLPELSYAREITRSKLIAMHVVTTVN